MAREIWKQASVAISEADEAAIRVLAQKRGVDLSYGADDPTVRMGEVGPVSACIRDAHLVQVEAAAGIVRQAVLADASSGGEWIGPRFTMTRQYKQTVVSVDLLWRPPS